MAENKNLGQNQDRNKGGQSGNLGGSQQQRGNQSSERLGLDEDLQQDVSTGGEQQQSGGRMGQGSQEDLGSQRGGSRHEGNQSGSSGRGTSGSSGSDINR